MIIDVCIVGGGASGLMAASYLSKRGLSVCLLEGSKELGKKLSLTGNGRCNITNKDLRSSCYNSSDDSFVSKIFEAVPNERLLSIIHEFGVSTKSINGYFYPMSLSAKSVVNALSGKNKNLSILFSSKVREIVKDDSIFKLYGDRESKEKDRPLLCEAKNVILSCGGSSFPKTGSDGSGYKLLEKMGLKVNRPLPALNSLFVNDFDRSLSGVRQVGKVKLFVDENEVDNSYGEIQFTKEGLSGICIYQVSSKASKALDKNKKVEICLDYLPEMNESDVKAEIYYRYKNLEGSSKDVLNTLFPDKMINHLLNTCNIDEERESSSITDKELNLLVTTIKNDKFDIIGIDGFKTSQTTTGGLDLSEVDDNMQSKKIKNLFITGELLDCDGICGGYNLYLAFSSAIIAADRILNK
ncbi:MAG: aminoacetone oxidase family FAD-binding enzyme [Lachnospiraceae bacterium]|nr:aminoacetone oxidase family FAD-binding enzyme [Lachnospiraceae bacterium]